MHLETHKTYCPHCGERIEVVVDPSASQEYIEDCQVCCNPFELRIIIGDGNESSIEIFGDI